MSDESFIAGRIKNPPWAARPLAQQVLAAFAQANAPIKFVGGCVRDAIIGAAHSKTDLDMATSLHPQTVIALLEKNNITAVPTGIAYGTVTAVSNGDKIEITSLRADIKTDGRHAVVQFGAEDAPAWQADAARRDFTFNALYASAAGAVFDYFGGVADLEAGRVRFIGPPAARLAEDYLRILRYFRFLARFGKQPVDDAVLAVMTASLAGLEILAPERIWQEFSKIICLDEPLKALLPMQTSGVLAKIFASGDVTSVDVTGADFAKLHSVAAWEAAYNFTPRPALRLAALFPTAPAEKLAGILRLSNRNADWLALAQACLAARDDNARQILWYEAQHVIYSMAEALPALALMCVADEAPVAARDAAITRAAHWQAPVLPVVAADLMAAGLGAGPSLGAALARAEQAWIESGFKLDKAGCMQVALAE